MSGRQHSSEAKSRTLGDYSVGGDSRTCTFPATSEAHYKYFKWLDELVEENIDIGSSSRNTIFKGNRLVKLEKRVMELEMELNNKLKNDVRGIQDNKCLRFTVVGLISILLVLAVKGMF
ncbi:hypothetical protein PIB30_027692 [Stylosanthes scabra]|uniref:Uncharacterized protein n=1 Tax=Stylosanthes scabra TaxID=79078 RepID=A0ABU6U9K2_9FABA|nr:hypothetical protein [Stylosanthes scabra]